MIDGVKIIEKQVIGDERGKIMHMLKATDEEFLQFGEIYFSCGYPGVVKGWHLHTSMTLNNFCVSGTIKLVIYDDRNNSPTKGETMEVFMGENANNVLVQIPKNLWNGYKVYSDKMAIVANCATEAHDKNGIIYLPPHNNAIINYNWDRKDG